MAVPPLQEGPASLRAILKGAASVLATLVRLVIA